MPQSPDTVIDIRRFGRTDLNVSAFGLGCARIGGIFKRDPADFVDLLSAALDAGITFFDTADIYSQGESEKLLAARSGTGAIRWSLPARRGTSCRPNGGSLHG